MAAMAVPSARLNALLFIEPIFGCHITTTVNTTSVPRLLNTSEFTVGMTDSVRAMETVTKYCSPMINHRGTRNALPGLKLADFWANPNSDASTADNFFSCCALWIAAFVLAIHFSSWNGARSSPADSPII